MTLKTLFSLLLAAAPFAAHAVWSPPIQITNYPSSVISPGTPSAIDSHSNTLVGWLAGPNPGTSNEIFSAVLPGGSTVWGPAELIFSNMPPDFPAYPFMLIDGSDAQTAGFGVLNLMPGSLVINAARRPPNTTGWPAPIQATFSGISNGGGAQENSEGDILAVLAMSPNFMPPYTITIIGLPHNAPSWTAPIPVGVDNSSNPVAAVSIRTTTGIAAWKANTPPLALAAARYSFDDGMVTYVGDLPLPPGTIDVQNLLLQMDDAGNTAAFYTSTDGMTSVASAATLAAGSSIWSALIPVSNPSNFAMAASIAFNANGVGALLWGEGDLMGNGYIYAADFTSSGVLGTPMLIEGPIAMSMSLQPGSNLAVDPSGNMIALWGVGAGGNLYINVASKAAGQTWSPVTTLSTTGVTPHGVLSDQGTAVAVWIDSGTGFLMSSVDTTLFPLAPPSDVTGKRVTNKFLNATEHALKIHWVPSSLYPAAGYEIRRNGTVIGFVPATGHNEFVVILPSKKLDGIYTVNAVASNGNRSVPTPVTIIK